MDNVNIGDIVYITNDDTKTLGQVTNITGNKISITWEDGTSTIVHINSLSKAQ